MIRRRGRSPVANFPGMALIEALIALLVVAIGMMGIASLILQSLRESEAALAQTQAVNLVSDMQERIRANPGAGAAYDCAAYSSGPAERGCAPASGAGSNCTPPELAEDDLARWQSSVSVALPSSGAGLCEANVIYVAPGSAAEASKYRISVSWRQRNGGTPAVYQSDLVLAPLASSP